MNLDPLYRWERRIGALPMPSPIVWAALVAAFLGFGVLMGRATGPESLGALASNACAVEGGGRRRARRAPPPAPARAPPRHRRRCKPKRPRTVVPDRQTSKPRPRSAANESLLLVRVAERGSEGSSGGEGSSPEGSKAKLPAIKHVFVVMLSDEPYATAFGPASPAHYLAGTLEKQGELLVRYYAVAHEGLADGIALLSGQGPTEATAANCPTYAAMSSTSAGADGQVLGKGCVYPASTKTLPGQLTAKHLTWKAYVEGMDEGGGGPGACAHPAGGAADPSAVQATAGTSPRSRHRYAAGGSAQTAAAAQTAVAGYETWRNPFVYLGSIVGSPACVSHDVGMNGLRGDLASKGGAANFTYIAPGPCDDGSPRRARPASPPGMAAADSFLKKVVPEILASKAYKKDGMLAITVDQAPASR